MKYSLSTTLAAVALLGVATRHAEAGVIRFTYETQPSQFELMTSTGVHATLDLKGTDGAKLVSWQAPSEFVRLPYIFPVPLGGDSVRVDPTERRYDLRLRCHGRHARHRSRLGRLGRSPDTVPTPPKQRSMRYPTGFTPEYSRRGRNWGGTCYTFENLDKGIPLGYANRNYQPIEVTHY